MSYRPQREGRWKGWLEMNDLMSWKEREMEIRQLMRNPSLSENESIISL